MGTKPPSIAAGPASNDDTFFTGEDAVTSGSLVFDVVANDARKGTLYSLDDANVSDLLTADQVMVPDHSQLGAAIWITGNGKVGYSMDGSQVQSLAAGETLQDSFLYAVKLPNGSLVWSTAHVTINGTNDAPVAHVDSATVAEDSLATGSVAANDTDVDHGAVLTFTAASPLPAGFALAANGTWALDASDSAYQSLGAGQTMQLSVAYTATDEHGATSNAALVLTITGANDGVSVDATFQDGWFSEDGGSMAGTILFSDADLGDGHSTSATQVSAGDAFGTLVVHSVEPYGEPGTHALSWRCELSDPNALQFLGEGEEVNEQYEVAISDGHGGSATQLITVVFRGRDDDPVANDSAVDLQLSLWAEQGPLSGTVVATDPDHDTSLVYVLDDGLPGFNMNPDGSWTYTPFGFDAVGLAQGETGTLYLRYHVADELGARDDAVLQLNLIGANDAPISALTFVDVTGDTTITGVFSALELDHGDRLTYSIAPYAEPLAGLMLHPDGSWTFDTSDPAYQGLAAGETINLGVPIVATDQFGASDEDYLVFNITGTNDDAVISGSLGGAVIEASPANPGTPQATGQLNIHDVDGDSSFVSVSGQASAHGYGSFSVSANGGWTYVLDNGNSAVDQLGSGQNLSDSFDVTAADGTKATVTITIAGANDYTAPQAYTGVGDPVDNNQTTGNGSGTTNYVGTEGPDAIIGSWFNDFIDAKGGADTILGGDGNDQVLAGLGNDSVYGGAGGDILSGMGGDDQIWGGTGNDDIAGQDGNDLLYGGSNWDVISGGAGADYIVGGYGSDELYGGTGFDTFVYRDVHDTNDVIYDFEFGDMLDFRGIDANPTTAGDDAFVWAGSAPAAHSLWAVQQNANWVIYGDTDGDLSTAEFMVTLQSAAGSFGPNQPGIFL